MLGVGVIGAGRHGERYVRHLARGDVPGAQVRALWRRDVERGAALAAEVKTRFEANLDRLITAGDVDVLIAAVPVSLHLAVATRVAAAKKPLLLEKPLARNVAEGEAIRDAFVRAGLQLMVAQTLRFDPLVGLLRVRARELGGLAGFGFEQRIEPRGLAWEDDPAVAQGGVLLQTGVHTLDALRFVTTPSRLRLLAAHRSRVHTLHNEDQAELLVALESPLGRAPSAEASGTVATSKVGQARTVRFTLHHAEGTIEADLIRRLFTESRGRERKERAVPEVPTVAAAAAAFVACVQGDAPNLVPADEALATIAVIEAAYGRMNAAEAQLTGGGA